MSDKRLLEMAAKAAGIDGWWEEGYLSFIKRSGGPWRPLTDDGDALRLGVKVRAFGNPDFIRHLGAARFALQDQDDPAAYRRAIVWVAAAIGEQMP